MTTRSRCKHCNQYRYIHGRNLCMPCYKNKSIRKLYPLRRPEYDIELGEDATAEQIEAVIAAQQRNLPKWWTYAAHRQSFEDYRPVSKMMRPIKIVDQRGVAYTRRYMLRSKSWIGAGIDTKA